MAGAAKYGQRVKIQNMPQGLQALAKVSEVDHLIG
jgi:ABC-type transporter Mla MlaB component